MCAGNLEKTWTKASEDVIFELKIEDTVKGCQLRIFGGLCCDASIAMFTRKLIFSVLEQHLKLIEPICCQPTAGTT
jgi:hypothetical protein